MSILERNLQALERLGASGLFLSPPPAPEDISLAPACRGLMTMRFQVNGRWLHVHSAYDPEAEAQAIAAKVNPHYDGVAVVFGAGLMYHVKALAVRAGAKCRILAIEPDIRAFALALEAVDLSDIFTSGKAAFSIGQTGGELDTFLNAEITSANYFLTARYVLPAYAAKYPEARAALDRVLDRLIRRRQVETLTRYNRSGLWARNRIKNTKYLPGSVRHWSFRQRLAGIPAVIVSAGPSLDRNAALLARFKDKAFIIAAYTGIKTLQKHGVKPDVFAAADARQLLRETPEEQARPLETPLLYTSDTDYRLVAKAGAGRIFASGADDRYIRECYASLGYEDAPIFASGSVAVAAADFAATAGCDPIIFVGQDLALTGERLHSAGVWDSSKNIETQFEDTFFVNDVFGGKVRTNAAMDMYRRSLEEYIGYDARVSGRVYIDATEGGAVIAGTRIMPLAEAFAYAEKGPGGVGERLKAHFADAANYSISEPARLAYLREIAAIHRDIATNPEVLALAGIEGLTGEDDLRLADRVSAWLKEKTAYLDLDLRRAESMFIHQHGQAYINREFSADGREAYLLRRVKETRMLLRWLDIYSERVADISAELQ